MLRGFSLHAEQCADTDPVLAFSLRNNRAETAVAYILDDPALAAIVRNKIERVSVVRAGNAAQGISEPVHHRHARRNLAALRTTGWRIVGPVAREMLHDRAHEIRFVRA